MVTLLLGYPPCGSIIARAQGELDKRAREFMNAELTKTYKYLFLDAIRVTIKEGRLGRDWMVLVAVGIDESGYKEVVGFARSRTESGAAWRRLLNQLVERGLDYQKLDLVVSDDSSAIAYAVDDVFGDVPVQLCWMHRMANLKDIVRKADHQECVDDLRKVYKANNKAHALRAHIEWRRKWAGKYPGFAAELQKDLGKLLAFFACPNSQWEYLRTNNPIERLNGDIRGRIFGWAGFADRDSCYRLLYGLFWQRNGDWMEKPKLQFTH
jgi:putative transposase